MGGLGPRAGGIKTKGATTVGRDVTRHRRRVSERSEVRHTKIGLGNRIRDAKRWFWRGKNISHLKLLINCRSREEKRAGAVSRANCVKIKD